MNSIEREYARNYAKRQEAMKDPKTREYIEEREKRKREQNERAKVLENWSKNGFYRPPNKPEEPRQKTASEIRHDDILEHFS